MSLRILKVKTDIETALKGKHELSTRLEVKTQPRIFYLKKAGAFEKFDYRPLKSRSHVSNTIVGLLHHRI